jgi:hypothetical protein
MFHFFMVRVMGRGGRFPARRGYWSACEKELTAAADGAATPVNTALTGALASLSDSVNTRAVSVWTGFAKADAEYTRVMFTWEANPIPNGEKPARLEIQPVDEAGKETMPAQVIGGAPGELPLMATFALSGGRHRLRFTVFTAAGELIDRWVVAQPVPDLSQESLVLTTPKILRARNMLEMRAIEANPNASPTASTRFTPLDRVLVEIDYQALGGQTPQIKVDLLNAKGELLRTLPTPPPADGRVRMPLPVSSLANSTYVLRIEAAAGEQTTQQWVAFRIAR